MAKLPRLRHVKYVHAKGKVYAYFDTGKKVDGKPIYGALPHPGAIGFYDSYASMLAGRSRRSNPVYTVAALAHDYEASKEFASKAKGTQITYRLTINKIVPLLGEFPVNELDRNDVTMALEAEIKGPGAYNLFVAVLGALYRYGRRTGKTTANPTSDIVKMETGEHKAWPEALVEEGLRLANPRTRLAIHLLYFTGQRIGDVIGMRWSDIKGETIHVTQQKTGKRLVIPLASELREELARTVKTGMTILAHPNGKPIHNQTIRDEIKSFGKERGYQVVPHGLRKSAVISLLEAGCTIAETAAITGQTFQLVEYYARQVDQARLGSAAILKLENKRGTGKRSGKLAV